VAGYPMKTFTTKNSVLFIAGIAVLLIVWKIISVATASNNLVPSPEDTLFTFLQIAFSKSSMADLFSTVLRGLAGFLIAFVLAFITGILSGWRTGIHAFLKPLLIVLRSTPVVAFILLLLIWFETDRVPVIIAFITMFPILYTNITRGMQEVDTSFKEMIQVYGLSRMDKLRSVYLPSISAFVFSGASTALGFGWRAIIIGEVLSQPVYGIGSRMREAYGYFEVQEVISWAILAVLLSFVFDILLSGLEKYTVAWKRA
jgi:NitT/TauT family transport system permease protein